jgi:acyl-CoA thioesterase
LKTKTLTKAEINALIDRMPFNQSVGVKVTRMYADGLSLECAVTDPKKNMFGTLHGGLTATLVDAAVGLAVLAAGAGRAATTVELKVNYLRPVAQGKVRARGRLLKVGKTLIFGTAEIHDSHGALIAQGTATYMWI